MARPAAAAGRDPPARRLPWTAGFDAATPERSAPAGRALTPSRTPPCGAGGANPPPRLPLACTPAARSRTPCGARSAGTAPWPARTPPAGDWSVARSADMRRSPHPHPRAAAADPPECPFRARPVRPPAKLQARHLAGAQAQPQQHDDHGVVTPPERRTTITAVEQRAGVCRADPPRQRRAPAAGHRQRRLRQVNLHQPLDEAETQKRPQPGHEELRRAHRHRRRLAQHRPRHLSRRQTGELTARWQPAHEPTCMPHIPADRAGRQAALGEQVALEGSQEHLRWRNRLR